MTNRRWKLYKQNSPDVQKLRICPSTGFSNKIMLWKCPFKQSRYQYMRDNKVTITSSIELSMERKIIVGGRRRQHFPPWQSSFPFNSCMTAQHSASWAFVFLETQWIESFSCWISVHHAAVKSTEALPGKGTNLNEIKMIIRFQ